MIADKILSILRNSELRWTIYYQFITLFGGIILVKLLTVVLSKSGYGEYSLVTSTNAFIMMMPFSALLQGVSRYISVYDKQKKLGEFINSILILFCLIVFLYLSLFVLVKNSIEFNEFWHRLEIILVLYCFSELLKVTLRTISNALRYRSLIAKSVTLDLFIKLGGIYIISLNYDIEVESILNCIVVSNIVSILYYIYRLKSEGKINRSLPILKEFKSYINSIVLFSYPLIIWGVFGWLRDMSNRWYLDAFHNKELVAVFSLLTSIAIIGPVALQNIINAYFIPIIYEKSNSDNGFANRMIRILLPSLLLVFSSIFLFSYFFHEDIVLLLSSNEYLEYSWALPWMIIVYSIYIMSIVSTYNIYAKKKTNVLLVSSIIPGLVSLVLGYYLIPRYGFDGAFINYVVTYFTYAVLTFLTVYLFEKYKLGNSNDSCKN